MKGRKRYSWGILGGLFVVYVITNGVVLNTLPIFYPLLSKEFDWTQAEVTRPAQLLFLAVALTSPFIGVLLDKFSAKRLMLYGAIILLVSFVWYSYLRSLNEMMGVYLLLSLGITAAGIIPSMRIITRWFVKKRGMAVGILLVGSSVGGAVFNLVAGSSIEQFGWRPAMLILGVISVLLLLLPILFVIKNSPEEVGLLPDDAQAIDELADASSVAPTAPILFRQVIQTPTFYLLLFITGAMWFTIMGVIQHQALYFEDLNTTISSKNVLSLFFASSIIGKLLFGWISDFYSKKSIMLLAVINLAIGSLLLLMIQSDPDKLLWIYAVVFGIGFSGTFTMIQLLVAEYYAGISYGKILGLVTMIDTLAGVMGILILGQIRTESGSYHPAFQIMMFITVVAAFCVPFLKKPIPND